MVKKMCFVLTISMVICIFTLTPAFAAADKWSHAHNASGVSEAAVKVIKKIPLGGYDLIIAAFNPLTSIAGSGCTVEGGNTSFAYPSVYDQWYQNGGVTLTPASFELNNIVAHWFGEAPEPTSTKGTSGVSVQYKYELVPAASGGTQWAIKVYVPAVSNINAAGGLWEAANSGLTKVWYREICATSGGSLYCGPSIGRGSSALAGTSLNYTSSTTFYALNPLGWSNGVTPYIFVIGERKGKNR